MKKLVLFTIFAVLLGFGAFFVLKNEVFDGVAAIDNGVDNFPSAEFIISQDILESSEEFDDKKVFTHPGLGFSFSYPTEYSIGGFADEFSEQTIVVQPIEQGDASLPSNAGFQIRITEFDEDIELDPARILQDLPEFKIAAPQKIALDGVYGVAFISDNPAFGGESREIWIVHAGHLYQISSYLAFSPWLEQIIGTWKW